MKINYFVDIFSKKHKEMATLYENSRKLSEISTDISCVRTEYCSFTDTLLEEHIVKNPFKLFKDWFDVASKCSQIKEANAMCLATATRDGYPSARYVLLKFFDHKGLTFFTNYNSRKGKELEQNPNVAVVFYWEPLHRSIRIEGNVSKIDENKSTEYFQSRPLESRIGACVSNQSSVICNRDVLTNNLVKLKKQFENEAIPRPENWGGFLITPRKFEFWQGQSNRLHDRIVFRQPRPNEKVDESVTHAAEDGWVYERLAP